MIGVFDSGVGGLCAYGELRRRWPREDMIYLADRDNAPYGTKSAKEILHFTEKNIRLLKDMGATAVLIACCSASSIYEELSPEDRAIAPPIIAPSARMAAEGGENIAVIATRHTVGVRAFGREIARHSRATVTEIAAQELVTMVEGGSRGECLTDECGRYLTHLADRIREAEADTLILGCTHFSHLEGEISRLLPHIRIISPARVGAEEITRKIKPDAQGMGRDTYI